MSALGVGRVKTEAGRGGPGCSGCDRGYQRLDPDDVHDPCPIVISDFPTRRPYGLALRQNHIERILAGWVDEFKVSIYREREVTGFVQDDTGVEVALADGNSLIAAIAA